jgi:uncharacterized membrane protein
MVDAYDPLRLACAVLAPPLVLGMLALAYKLRGDRGFGCIALAMFAVAVGIGNMQRIHETATPATYFAAAGTILGLLYVGRVTVMFSERRPRGKS